MVRYTATHVAQRLNIHATQTRVLLKFLNVFL